MCPVLTAQIAPHSPAPLSPPRRQPAHAPRAVLIPAAPTATHALPTTTSLSSHPKTTIGANAHESSANSGAPASKLRT